MQGRYRNISFATAATFAALLDEGADVTVLASDSKRPVQTRELRNRVTVLERPLERCLFLAGRGHEVFGQIAETMWVIAGRNDVEWLRHYFHRAPNYSDDGKTWRAGYGPRLRRWAGVTDQLTEWLKLFESDDSTRRAAGVLFDPAQDFVPDSKDVPCNNWLSWLIRDRRLYLTVGVRSNDALWGFSGVNAFEWSVLQEMMAFWLGVEVGDATYLATSYHFYLNRVQQVRNVVDHFYGVTPYDFGVLSPRFSTPRATFDAAMDDWFHCEEVVRLTPGAQIPVGPASQDPFLRGTLNLLRLKWMAASWSPEECQAELAALPEDDLAVAAYEFFARGNQAVLESIPHPKIKAFFETWQAAKDDAETFDLKAAIKSLQARKNASYAGAWKRRGERISVLPNIARKVDRLEAIFKGAPALDGETMLDTAIDLYVYALKYELFLMDQQGSDRSRIPAEAPEPISDHDINFDAMVDLSDFAPKGRDALQQEVAELVAQFEQLWKEADEGAPLADRQRWGRDLTRRAEHILAGVASADERAVKAFLRTEKDLARKAKEQL